MLQPGIILSNRYEIIEKIGSGGMSIVYKAKCNKLERFVAVKVLREEYCMDEQFVRKFKVEAQAAASLSHHNIVNIYDVGNDKKIYYIIMEYLEGITLKEYIRKNAPLSDKETIKIASAIVSALDHAHANHIIHRDIKPQNIIITKDGVPKVADFGIARVSTEATIVVNNNATGSVHYISPEQARGSYSNEKSDLYSLGITMYEMATGTLPYQAESPVSVALQHIKEELPKPREKNPNISIGLESIIIKATKKNAENRYQSAKELIDDLLIAGDSPNKTFVNETTEDDSPTILMSDSDMKKIWDESDIEEDKVENKKLEKTVVIFGIVSAIIIATVISLFAYKSVINKLVPNEIAVPEVEGMNLEEATVLLEEQGLIVNVTERKYDDELERDDIIEQSPAKDSVVNENTVIDLVVSNGIESFEVPDVVNLQFKTAERLINEANLTYNRKLEYHDTIPTGVIIRQYPGAGKTLAKGSEVTIVASLGKEQKKIIVPDVKYMSEDEAIVKLKESGLDVGSISYSNHDQIDKGHVIFQTVNPGEEVIEGHIVDLAISLGKKIVKKKSITVTNILYSAQDNGQLKVVVVSEDKEEVVFDELVEHEDFPLKIPVTGEGQATVKIYLDNYNEYNYTINFDEVDS